MLFIPVFFRSLCRRVRSDRFAVMITGKQTKAGLFQENHLLIKLNNCTKASYVGFIVTAMRLKFPIETEQLYSVVIDPAEQLRQ